MIHKNFDIILGILCLTLALSACAPAPEVTAQYDPAEIRFSGERAYAIEGEFVTSYKNRVSGSEENRLRDIAQMDRSATIVGQGMINFMDPTTNKYIQGKYFEVNTESKQVMVGLWWCTGDDRDYILHLENGQAEMGIETLYLFQRYLISFHCQEPKTE